MVRVYAQDMKRLWDLVKSDRRSLAEVIHYLLDFYDSHPPSEILSGSRLSEIAELKEVS